MKQSGTTTVFVIICIAVLLGAWGTGLCIRQVRFRNAGIESKAGAEPQMSAEIQKPTGAGKPESERAEMAQFQPERGPMPGGEGRRPFGDLSEEERERRREQFENMSEEERQEFRAQMRERFGGMRRGGGESFQNLSEEERASLREEMEELRGRWEQMSEEEREDARSQISEKYGFVPRMGLGGRPGGDRGPGGGEGGRRRPGGRRQ
jgi:hypothetical protein